jgi:hypothetical protein
MKYHTIGTCVKSEVQLNHSYYWHYIQVCGQLHTLTASTLGKQNLVPIGEEAYWVVRCKGSHIV